MKPIAPVSITIKSSNNNFRCGVDESAGIPWYSAATSASPSTAAEGNYIDGRFKFPTAVSTSIDILAVVPRRNIHSSAMSSIATLELLCSANVVRSEV
jgi:hypothetical protein